MPPIWRQVPVSRHSVRGATSTGRLVFHIFAALAEFERELIAERAAVGRAAARTRGRLGGRLV